MFVSVADKMDDETCKDQLDLMDEIDRLKETKQATILAHYYVDGDLQDIADFTGDNMIHPLEKACPRHKYIPDPASWRPAAKHSRAIVVRTWRGTHRKRSAIV